MPRIIRILTVIILSIIFFGFVNKAESSIRARGSLGVRSYGYQDSEGEDHLWIIQSTQFVLQSTTRPYSLHFSGGYIGDNQDDFSNSGRGRLLRGYLQYGKFGSDTRVKLGRFFLYKGTAVGVFDGAELNQKIKKNLRLQAFAGVLGPRNRDFEMEKFDESFSAGGELKLTPGDLWRFSRSSFAMSYSALSRAEGDIRNRLGLSARVNLNRNISMLALAHLNTRGSFLRRALARLRYSDNSWNGMLEAGITSVDIATYSWLSSFEHLNYPRIRFNINRRFGNKWSAGLDGTTLLQGGGFGMRLGPMVGTPYGQAGYRMSFGDQALSAGPWVNLNYQPISGLTVYSTGSMTTYEWEKFNIESDDLTLFEAGMKYDRLFDSKLDMFVEYQLYQSPQMTSDRRVLGGIKYKFDSRRAGK